MRATLLIECTVKLLGGVVSFELAKDPSSSTSRRFPLFARPLCAFGSRRTKVIIYPFVILIRIETFGRHLKTF
jgi:hypothetical protein